MFNKQIASSYNLLKRHNAVIVLSINLIVFGTENSNIRCSAAPDKTVQVESFVGIIKVVLSL